MAKLYVQIAFAGGRTGFMVSRMDNPTWVFISFGSPGSLTAWFVRCRPSKSMETKTTLFLLISVTEGRSRGGLGRGPSPKKYCRSSSLKLGCLSDILGSESRDARDFGSSTIMSNEVQAKSGLD